MASRQIGKCLFPSTLIIIQPNDDNVFNDFIKFAKGLIIISKNERLIETRASELYFYLKNQRNKLTTLDKIRRVLYRLL